MSTSPQLRVSHASSTDRFLNLSLTNFRELLRDRTTFFFVLIFPFAFIALFALIGASGTKAKAGGTELDAIRFGLPGVLLLGFGSLAFLGTATTMVQLRDRGVLRLLGVTPLRRLTFIGSLVPARLAIAVFQLLVLAVIALIAGYLEVGALGRLLVSAGCGLAMLFSIGFLAGGIMRSPEATSTALSAGLPVVGMLCGILIPLQTLPAVFGDIASFIPLTYMGDALRQDLVGAGAQYAITTDWLICLGTAAVFTTLAALTFRWDQGE